MQFSFRKIFYFREESDSFSFFPVLLAYVGLFFWMQQRVEAYGVASVSRID